MQGLQREKFEAQIQAIYFIFSRITSTSINTNIFLMNHSKVINGYLTFK